MQINELKIPGVFLLHPPIYSDSRGVFRRAFCKSLMSDFGINTNVSQGNISANPIKGTFRGFHMQRHPYEEAKTMTCITGSVFNVVVDLRLSSPTFKQWLSVNILSSEGTSLHVPEGCANAWLTLEDNTIVHYYMSEDFHPESSFGFRYDDPLFNFVWPTPIRVISDKDKSYPDLNL